MKEVNNDGNLEKEVLSKREISQSYLTDELLQNMSYKEQEEQWRKSRKMKQGVYLMRIMKKKYDTRYKAEIEGNKDSKESLEEKRKKTKEAEQWIGELTTCLEEFKTAVSEEKRDAIRNSMSKLNKQLDSAVDLSFSLAQAKRVRKMVYTSFYNNLAANEGRPKSSVLRLQNFATKQLERAIEREVHETKDISKLKRLQKDLPPKDNEKSTMMGDIGSIIQRKIYKIESDENIRRMREEVPLEIEELVTGIVTGGLDVNQGREAIQKIVTERRSSNSKFRLTEEDQRKRVLIKIRTVLRDHPEQYPIHDAEKAIKILEALTTGETGMNLTAVVDNMIGNKRYEEAKGICGTYRKKEENKEIETYIWNLQKKVTIAEIGNLVSTTLDKPMTDEEMGSFWYTLKNGIEKSRVPLSSVVIGKNKEQTRTITLQDIWPESQRTKNNI